MKSSMTFHTIMPALSVGLFLLGSGGIDRLHAQAAYTAVDLTPSASGLGLAAEDGTVAGLTGSTINAVTGLATLWTGDGAFNLHPSFLDGASARSQVSGMSGGLLVGHGAGASTSNRNVPLLWRDESSAAEILSIPFTNVGGQANATDGSQVVGSAIGLNRDGTAVGSSHALVWTLATGAVVDLGTDASAFGVAGGQQVGYILKGSANAALWRGTKSYTLLHPKGAVTSTASGTDGVRQVGHAGFDIRVRQEAAKGNKNKRFTYAYVWTGTAASALNIHPYVSSADGTLLENSYALDVAGPYIAGYATVPTAIGTPAYYRAVVWDASYQATDLGAYLPSGFTGSQALAVDAQGNVAGVMTKPDGTRHAVMWVPNF